MQLRTEAMITPKTLIKDILIQVPGSQELLMNLGVRCLGWSAAWMTLEQAARGKNVDLEELIIDLESMRSRPKTE